MVLRVINIIIFFVTAIFIFFVFKYYLSEKNQNLINDNREKYTEKQIELNENLPFLKNNTNNVIEFNSGFNDEKNKKIRKFWDLFN